MYGYLYRTHPQGRESIHGFHEKPQLDLTLTTVEHLPVII